MESQEIRIFHWDPAFSLNAIGDGIRGIASTGNVNSILGKDMNPAVGATNNDRCLPPIEKEVLPFTGEHIRNRRRGGPLWILPTLEGMKCFSIFSPVVCTQDRLSLTKGLEDTLTTFLHRHPLAFACSGFNLLLKSNQKRTESRDPSCQMRCVLLPEQTGQMKWFGRGGDEVPAVARNPSRSSCLLYQGSQ